jgi:D-3-phosphoglycerate dehydrogenase
MPKCLIIDGMHESIIYKLQEAGIEVDYRPEITRQQVMDCLHSYEILVVRSKTPIDKELVDYGTKLKYVARAGAGIDNLDLEYLNKVGIDVINAPEGNRDAVGDHTIGMLLVLLNKIHVADRQVRQMIWDREANRGTELHNKTVGIVGYGNMGRAFAKRLPGFGCKVLAYDKYKTEYSDQYVEAVTMEDLFRESDILSLHVPLTSETNKMVNEDFLNKFLKNIYLINMARGEVVPMKSVVYGLESGKIISAALDVLECEKLAKLNIDQKKNFDILAASDQILLTPHIGGWSFESYQKISDVLAEKIIDKMG